MSWAFSYQTFSSLYATGLQFLLHVVVCAYFISVLAVDLLSPQFFRTQYSANPSVWYLKSNFIVSSHVAFLLRYLPLSAVLVHFSLKSENVITVFVTFVVNVQNNSFFFQQI